jgi:hypothetical protein
MKEQILAIIGWIIAPFIGAFIFMWYNYVLFQKKLDYLELLIISLAFFLVVKVHPKLVGPIVPVVFCVCVISQALAWCKIVFLPIFKF